MFTKEFDVNNYSRNGSLQVLYIEGVIRMTKPIINKILQIGIVVDDIYSYMKRYNDDYGIGPWLIYDFNNDVVGDMRVHGKRSDYVIKMAVCRFYDVEFELIEPRDDKSDYSDFLKKHGPGVHHIAFDTDDYDVFMKEMSTRGNAEIQGGHYRPKDIDFSYIDMSKDLGFVGEIYKIPEGVAMPVPTDETYPPKK
ncbi:MAG TPA: VOC family protein [Thermodesulfobacteriota bacterium]|nr:VOC family protein [Thermodesulfobacteriota bacterium]